MFTPAEAVCAMRPLTRRERQVVELVGLGLHNKEIAKQLVPACSPRTVSLHICQVSMKLGESGAAPEHLPAKQRVWYWLLTRKSPG